MRWLAVFLAVALSDALWTAYIRAVTRQAPALAACYSAGLVGLGAVVTLSVVADARAVLPAMLGAFAGTWLVARRG
jgi:hypothetical protein